MVARPSTLPAIVSLRLHAAAASLPASSGGDRLHLQMRAPQRKVTLSAVRPDGQKELIDQWVSPTGLQTVSIKSPAWLDALRSGSIDFELNIGTQLTLTDGKFGDQQAQWQVDFFRLTVDGQVLER